MTAVNHALTGAVIGLAVSNPVAALILAFVSHFVLDSVPHYGPGNTGVLKSRAFVAMLAVDAALCFTLVLLLATTQPHSWLLAALCAFTAASPDFMWFPGYLRLRRNQPERGYNWIMKLHANVQWFQRPIGAVVEGVWFVVTSALVAGLVR